MGGEQTKAYDTDVAVVRAILDHLVAIATGFESAEWLAKYIAIQNALADGRVKDAVREAWKLVDYRIETKWIVSRELANKLRSAVNNLARKLQLPNYGVQEIRLDDLPTSVTDLGTLVEESARSKQAYFDSIKRDPLYDTV